ncbi:MAG: hypothetical protein U5O16_37355 [Rhodococcus sp. (in: high G+C Gram-positive bacteria)]|uniref:hypothetical protein n=1 Tax=Rhodococcus sp. TaxID=1831 RepID=UPI002ADBF583|nr:hypothetical protein [Rhodococcus sp. (in: high G+C Gram-positive bacteria)]
MAPSVELGDVTVTVSVWSTDPSLLGTFDRAAETQLVRVAINARSNAVMAAAGVPRKSVRLPVEEQIAWARVVLGDLADYAYRIVTDWELLRVRPAFFMVLVADDGSPQLAPSDFTWILASSGGRRAYPEKLVPEDRSLLAHLRRYGDLVDADLVPRPRASLPEVWAQQFVSHLTAAVADELGRMGNSQWFTFGEVSLHGANQVIVRYTWHLAEGDKEYGFDIDLAGVREQRLQALDDPRASSAGGTIGLLPFDQPVFRAPTVIDGVTWIRFGASE